MIEVPVTQHMIDHANRGSGRSCALACGLQAKGYRWAVAGSTHLRLSSDAGAENYHYNEKLTQWVRAFDRGRKVKPITVNLNKETMRATYDD